MDEAVQPPKRGQGRPKGAGKPDGDALRQVADLLVSAPGLRATTAIKRVIGAQNASNLRRFQVKWKAADPALLSEARQRNENRRVKTAALGAFDVGQFLGITGGL
jgi:hypothetical protein